MDERHDCRNTDAACVPSTVWGTASNVTAKFRSSPCLPLIQASPRPAVQRRAGPPSPLPSAHTSPQRPKTFTAATAAEPSIQCSPFIRGFSPPSTYGWQCRIVGRTGASVRLVCRSGPGTSLAGDQLGRGRRAGWRVVGPLRMFAASARGAKAQTIMSSNSASDLIGRAPGGRKLIAVLHADMAGYSRLIGLDDIGTLERLKTLRSTLIDPAIAEHGGRVVNTGGDSLLIVFDSVDGAVQCAIKVQQQVPAYEGEQSPDRTIRFRVGINVGDVIPEGTDVHGDVVNVAARLQAECPPGGVCVSRAVRDHARGRLDRDFEALGPLSLKNIAQPVEAFVLRLDSGKVGRDISVARMSIGTPQVSARPLLLRPRSIVFTTLALLVFAILGGIAWSLLRAPRPMQISAATSDFGIKNAPRLSLVVLPFQNLSGSPSDDYLADGITEDLTTDLSLMGAFVIARDSAYTY